ncbi:alpha/beta hydrolase [Hyphomicrobiales bacterium BP6-180914]|uniref:Alpha/beta hydrolase n=1 Tax=Lichenifustis flavocetrariae TaxID=2949735 RepID=A0AA41YSM5_9HYPH|nr:alpha/beta hydrolase [Lichenifustis flavocetrariae]
MAPDLPGFGHSSKPERGFDKKTVARCLQGLVKAVGLPRVTLVGHDLKGHIAYAYAARDGRPVRSRRRQRGRHRAFRPGLGDPACGGAPSAITTPFRSIATTPSPGDGRCSPVPVLAVGAAGGYAVASASTIRRVARDVRDVLIKRCGHYPAEEWPAELGVAIQNFLAEPSTPATA